MRKQLYRRILRQTDLLLEVRKNQNRLVEILVLSEPAGKTRFCPVLYIKRRPKSNGTCFTGVSTTYITKKYFFRKYLVKSDFLFLLSITRVCAGGF